MSVARGPIAPTSSPELTGLAETIAAAMPPLSPPEQILALALYRRLAQAAPVLPSALAADSNREPAAVEAMLERWPGVYRDDDGRIVGFWGLAIPEMPHRFRVDGRQLHTWCAWDALFIPELIGRKAEVESQPPASGESVRLTISVDHIDAVQPAGTVVSMLPPGGKFESDVIARFCHFVHFFPSAAKAQPWLTEHEGTFLLSLDEAFELGRRTNRLRFPDALGGSRT